MTVTSVHSHSVSDVLACRCPTAVHELCLRVVQIQSIRGQGGEERQRHCSGLSHKTSPSGNNIQYVQFRSVVPLVCLSIFRWHIFMSVWYHLDRS